MSRFAPRSRVSPDEHSEWAARLWSRLDREGRGSIRRQDFECKEFRSVLRAILVPETAARLGAFMGGPSYSRAQMNVDEAVSFCMRKSSNKLISFEEFEEFMLSLREERLPQQTAGLLFALFDINRDGILVQSEFRELFRFFVGQNPAEIDFQEEWARLDAQATGRISRADLARWLQCCEDPIFLQGKRPETAEESNDAAADERGIEAFELPSKPSWRPWHSYGHLGWAKVAKVSSRPCPDAGGAQPISQTGLGGSSGSNARSRSTPNGFGKNTASWRKRSAGGVALGATCPSDKVQPRWNHQLAGASPNWVTNKTGAGNLHLHKSLRTTFSRPQSLPDLQRYYEHHPRLQANYEKLLRPEPARRPCLLSEERHDLGAELLPNRQEGRKVGSQRHPLTGERRRWKHNFQTPSTVADKYTGGTLSLRCPGPAPRHLYVDDLEDDY